MLKLLEDLRSSPIPAELGAPPLAFAEFLAEASNELLRAKFGIGPGEEFQGRDTLAVYASWLESIALLATEDSAEVERGLYVAGGIREFLYRVDSLRSLASYTDLDLLGTMLVSSASSHPAVGMLFARRCLSEAKLSGTNDVTKGVRFTAVSAIAALAARRFVDAIAFERRAVRLSREIQWTDLKISDVAEIEALLFLSGASASLSWGMLFGVSTLAELAIKSVESRLQGNGDVSSMPTISAWLAERWLHAAEHIWAHSAQRKLRELDFPLSYRRRLVADGIVEFWPDQLQALQAGLLDARPFVVSLPTGSGKTLLAELALLRSLTNSGVERSWGCYVAPSRALVGQVQRELSRRLGAEEIAVRSVLGGSEESVVTVDEIAELSSPRTLTVTTPEKLEAYYRASPEIFDGLAILVLDEAHLLGDPSRGPLIEHLVSRIRVQQREAKVVLLSAAASNPEDLASWLGGDAGTFAASARLNRQELAIAVKLVSEVPEVQSEYQYRGEPRQRVTFPGGLVTASDLHLADAEGRSSVQVGVPGAFKISVRQRVVQGEWKDLEDDSTAVEHSRQLAERLHQLGETTLVFCPTRDSARKQAEDMAAAMGSISSESSASRALARLVQRYIGAEHPLVALIELGVAYHHGLLPPMVQRLLEHALSEGWIRTLFTTTTLREGINLPAQNCIVAGEQRFDEREGRTRDMDIADFVNMAGRAGRPNIDSEGLAILVPNRLANAWRVSRKYFLYGPDALAVRSSLNALVEALERSADQGISGLSARDQALLLSLYAGGLRSDERLRSFFEQTLLFTQSGFDSDRIAEICVKALCSLESDLGAERVALISRLGFGLEGSVAVIDFVQEHLSSLARPDIDPDFGASGTHDLLSLCLSGCSRIPELRVGQLAGDDAWESGAMMELGSRWIQGVSFGELGALTRFHSDSDGYEVAMSRAVAFFGQFSQWLPWGLGAIQFAVSALGSEPNAFICHLPLYVRFGVPTRVAALLSLAGVFDRDAAQELATQCPLDKPTLSDIEAWYKGIDLDEVLGRDPRSSILRRRGPDLNAVAHRFRALPGAKISLGTPCVIKRDGTQYVAFDLEGERLASRRSTNQLERFPEREEGLFGIIAGTGDKPLVLVLDVAA